MRFPKNALHFCESPPYMNTCLLWTVTIAYWSTKMESFCYWGQERYFRNKLWLMTCNDASWADTRHCCSPSLPGVSCWDGRTGKEPSPHSSGYCHHWRTETASPGIACSGWGADVPRTRGTVMCSCVSEATEAQSEPTSAISHTSAGSVLHTTHSPVNFG